MEKRKGKGEVVGSGGGGSRALGTGHSLVETGARKVERAGVKGEGRLGAQR